MLSLSFIFYRDRKNIYAIIIYRGKLSKRRKGQREARTWSVRNCGERGRKSKGRVPDNLSTGETSPPLNPEPQRALPLNEMKRLTLRRKYVKREREEKERKNLQERKSGCRTGGRKRCSFLSRRRVTFNRNKNFPYFPNARSRGSSCQGLPFCNTSTPLYGWNCTEGERAPTFTRNVFLVIVIDDRSPSTIRSGRMYGILEIPFFREKWMWTILFVKRNMEVSHRVTTLIRRHVEKLNRIPRV